MSGDSGGAAPQSDDSTFAAYNVITGSLTTFALKAVLKLGIPDILAKADGKPLSAAEILAQLLTKSTPGRDSVTNLRRLMSPLVREGLFTQSLDGEKQQVYGLTKVGNYFVSSHEPNHLTYTDFCWSLGFPGAMDYWHEVILDETVNPFVRSYGMPFYEYIFKENPEAGTLFEAWLAKSSKRSPKKLMDAFRESGALDGVSTLVDVGGGRGYTLAAIVACHPRIQGVNFDLPEEITQAAPINGVRHVPGSFFESVPTGDAMLLKYILHNYGDDNAVKILQNCLKSLPSNGKVILAENFLMEQDPSPQAVYIERLDLSMLSMFEGGSRERTKVEYLGLLAKAGFPRSSVYKIPGSIALITGFKE